MKNMIISIRTEKPFNNIQNTFMIKIINRVNIEETYLHIIEGIMVIEMCQTEKDKYHIILLMCDI